MISEMSGLMPDYAQWNPRYVVGDEVIDNQHRMILAQCNALADCIADSFPGNDLKFGNIFDELMANARAHFSAEEKLLARCGCATLEEIRNERDEFEYLVANIATTEYFDKVELQRFLVSWWIGHIVDFGRKYHDSITHLPSQSVAT